VSVRQFAGLFVLLAAICVLAAPAGAATITEFPLPDGELSDEHPRPFYITAGPNGTLWYTDLGRRAENGQGGVVAAVNSDGEPLTTIDDLQATSDITSDAQGNVYWPGIFEFKAEIAKRPANGGLTTKVIEGLVDPEAVGLTAAGGERISGADLYAEEVFSICEPAPGNECITGLGSEVTDLSPGPGGVLWSMQPYSDEVVRWSTSGFYDELTLNLPSGSRPIRGVLGPDGNLWVAGSGTEQTQNRIFRITFDGQVTSFLIPPGREPQDITVGTDGALWFTEFGSNSIGRMTTAGEYSSCTLPSAASNPRPFGITTGGDGNVWFTERDNASVGRISGNCAPPPPAGPSAPGPGPGGTAGPVLGGLKLSPSSFRAAASGASISKQGATGTTISFRLSEAAQVSFGVQRKARGRKVGGKCKRQTRGNKAKPPCPLYRPLKGSFSTAGASGSNKLHFSGRLRGKPLAPGSYRLSARAKDAAGKQSTVVYAGFRILGR
jgi:virginiamycin B lyase